MWFYGREIPPELQSEGLLSQIIGEFDRCPALEDSSRPEKKPRGGTRGWDPMGHGLRLGTLG